MELDPISVFGRELDWVLHGLHPETMDPGLAFATILCGLVYMMIILGAPAMVYILWECWKEFKTYMRSIQVRPEES
jgi:hypothetical protein